MLSINERLTTNNKEKVTSLVGSLLITSIIVGLTFFIQLTAPDPPFDPPKSILVLDVGIVDGGYGAPDQGGPSSTPPALGGEEGGGANTPTSGGDQSITSENSDGPTIPKGLPPISQPTSTVSSKLGKILTGTKRTGTGGAGVPNGWPGGTGTTGSGGNSGGGIHGDGGKVPGTPGDGTFSSSFQSYKITNTVRKVDAEGTGKIVAKVRIECDGTYKVLSYNERGTNYTGTDESKVVNYFLRNANIVKKSDGDCPETSFISVMITKELAD